MLKRHKNACLVLDKLTLFSFFNILLLWIKHGCLLVRYKSIDRTGKILIKVFVFLKIVQHESSLIEDLFLSDDPAGRYHEFAHVSDIKSKLIRDKVGLILKKMYGDTKDDALLNLIALSVSKFMVTNYMNSGLVLMHYAICTLRQNRKNIQHVYFSSSLSCFLQELGIDEQFEQASSIIPLSQFPGFGSRSYLILRFISVFLFLLKEIVKSWRYKSSGGNSFNDLANIGIYFAAGINKKGFDDLFWWKKSNIPAGRMVFLFDRRDLKASESLIAATDKNGLKSAVLHSRSLEKDDPVAMFIPGFTFSELLVSALDMIKFSFPFLFRTSWERMVITEALYADVRAKYISNQYLALNLAAVFHYSETSHDFISIACEYTNAIRVGVHWSSAVGGTEISPRGHHVYFYWGNNDKKLGIASNTLSRKMLISGSILNDYINQETVDSVHEIVSMLKSKGCKCILALYDHKEGLSFYRFFLEWLLEDSDLGLLVKGKGNIAWNQVLNNGMNGVVDKAIATGRIVVLNSKYSPADISSVEGIDFFIGMGSLSALIISAINGKRVIYIDYEKVYETNMVSDIGISKLPYGQCVFYSHEEVKDKIKLFDSGKEQQLGDMSIEISQYDPYRDHGASNRIAIFMTEYLSSIDNLLGIDQALEKSEKTYNLIVSEVDK